MADKIAIGIIVNEEGQVIVQTKMGKGMSSDELARLIVYVKCFLDDLTALYRNKNIGTQFKISLR